MQNECLTSGLTGTYFLATQTQLVLVSPLDPIMNRLTEHSFVSPNRGWLPFDIVSQIIEEFVLELRFSRYDGWLDHESVSELLQLRLVSKTWSEAIIPFAFHTVQLHTSKGIQLIIDNWSKIQVPDLPCPVKRLMIQDLLYPGANGEKSSKKDDFSYYIKDKFLND